MDDSVIMCDEIMESYDAETKTVSTSFNEKNVTCKIQKFYILLAFLVKAQMIMMKLYENQISFR